MIEDTQKQEKNKQGLLWGGLTVLSLPAAPFIINDAIIEAAESLWQKIRQRVGDRLGHVPKPPPEGEVLYLKPEHSLYKWADETAKGQGLELGGILIRPEGQNKPVTNASVFFTKNRAIINFVGDPAKEDPSFTKALVAHELGHATAGDSIGFRKIAMTTTSAYALLAQTTLSLGVLAQGMQALPFVQNNDLNPFSAAMLGVGAASLVAIKATASLTKKFMHSVEHLADLKGSEIVGPDDTISTLETMKERNEVYAEAGKMGDQKNGPDIESKMEWLDMRLKDVWDKVMYNLKQPMWDTHPTVDVRQDFIRKAHGITEAPPQTTPVSTVARPHNVSMSPPAETL